MIDKHPAPWKWEAILGKDPSGAPNFSALRQRTIVDATSTPILDVKTIPADRGNGTEQQVCPVTPLVRELIRLAPEMEVLLRRVHRDLDTEAASADEREIFRLLEKLDAARNEVPPY